MHDIVRLLLEVDFAVWIVAAGELAENRGETVREVEFGFRFLGWVVGPVFVLFCCVLTLA